jgi:hypothetical protein
MSSCYASPAPNKRTTQGIEVISLICETENCFKGDNALRAVVYFRKLQFLCDAMPTISGMNLPTPSHWQDFETMVRDAQAQRWKSTTLQKNGRSGQKQDGVDIYGPDDIGRPVGIQCKRYAGSLKLTDVTTEISNAEKFSGLLNTLFIATTADNDAKLQQQVRILSERRVAQGKFAVGLLFWDDIIASLQLNPAVFRTHYPQLVLEVTGAIDQERQIAALEFGYFGADLWAYVGLIYGEFGWMAQVDPDELIATLRILERRVQQLFAPDDAGPILEALAKVREGCLAEKEAQSEWDEVEGFAKRASTRIQKASSLLAMEDSNVLELALQLGRMYHHADYPPSSDVELDIKAKVRKILGEAGCSHFTQAISKDKKLTSGYQWAMRAYSLLSREIRYRVRENAVLALHL